MVDSYNSYFSNCILRMMCVRVCACMCSILFKHLPNLSLAWLTESNGFNFDVGTVVSSELLCAKYLYKACAISNRYWSCSGIIKIIGDQF